MKKCDLLFHLTMSLLVFALNACGNKPNSFSQNTHAPTVLENQPFSILDRLVLLLQAGEFAKFYSAIDEWDLKTVRNKFEELRPDQRAALNYGALVNAEIVTDENRHLFKPDIRKIDHYVNIPNELKCWMNATLYSIANSSFFDDFLEIDRIFKERWNKRPEANLIFADRIIRSLRETVYEIRLGNHTTPERLAKARLRSLDALNGLGDLKTAAAFYHELFSSYELEQIEFIYKDPNSDQIRHEGRAFKHLAIEYPVLEEALIKHKPMDHLKGYGLIGALGCNLAASAGFVELMYLHALFIMLDPWGISMRYLSASVKEHTAGVDAKPRLHDPYQNKLVFEAADKKGNYHFFFNDWDFNYSVSIGAKDIQTKSTLGKLIYRQKAQTGSSLTLVAKTKGSTNHMIAEIYNFMRHEWETHNFFEPAQFSATESAEENGYKDLTYFYKEKSPE